MEAVVENSHQFTLDVLPTRTTMNREQSLEICRAVDGAVSAVELVWRQLLGTLCRTQHAQPVTENTAR